MAVPDVLFLWGQHYLTGVDEVDQQHEGISILLNRLHEAARVSSTRERQLELLDELISEVVAHFRTEEALMHDLGYDGLDLHKQEHDLLAGKASALRAGFKSGRLDSLDGGLEFIKDWLRNHLMTSDRRMGRFLSGRV